MNQSILSTQSLRIRLQECLAKAKDFMLISAYFTEEAADWLLENVSESASVTIIGRFVPSDFANGASSIKAISKVLDNNWKIACLSDLHAKIYAIDREIMFVGSANFTSNGLKLHGHGNLEASIETKASESNLEFVDSIINNAFFINHSILSEMEAYVDQQKDTLKSEKVCSEWPITIIPKDQKIWVTNFPWVNLSSEDKEESAIEHDKYIFGDNNEMFFQSKAFNWLCGILKEKENSEIYYGELSAKLHSDLIDDPRPYRKEVKSLLSNLLSYCEILAKEMIQVDRPNHSQRIRLFFKK